MKKLLSFMLVLAMLLSVAYVQVFATDSGRVAIGENDSTVTHDGDTYTVIRTLAELPKTAEANGRYILANDIDCSGSTLPKNTIVLGNGAILDGNGYGITNFKLLTTSDNEGKAGIFTLAAGGTYTVRNIHFGTAEAPCEIQNNIALRSDDSATTTTVWENVQVYMNHTRDGGSPGAFISTAMGTHTFKNCDVYIYSSAIKTSTGSNIGGFVGNTGNNGSAKLAFEGCNVYGSIISVNNIGGFIGYASDTNTATISFKNCNNYASLTLNGGNGVGGFIGYQRSTTSTVTYENCQNFGAMTALGATNVKEGYVGGIVGYDCGKTTFSNCRNYGALNTYKTAGGIAGYTTLEVSFEDCFNNGSVTSVIDLEKSSSDSYVGGIVGRASEATLTGCTNAATLTMTAPSSEKTVFGCGNLGGYVGTWSAENCNGFGTLIGANATKGVLYGVVSDETGTSTNNQFLMNTDNNENLNGAETSGRVTAEDAITILSAKYEGEKFIIGDSGSPVVATPKLKAVQAGAKDTSALRFVGTVNTLNFNKAGFKYTVTYAGEAEPSTDDVGYTQTALGAIKGKEDDLSLSISASELGGVYLYTYTITGLRSDVNATIVVTPITVVNGVDGAEATVYEGTTVTLVYNNGEIISAN